MNRYPLWKYGIIVFAVIFGLLYASPTLFSRIFGTAPVVNVSPAKTDELPDGTLARITSALQQAGIEPANVTVSAKRIVVRLQSVKAESGSEEAKKLAHEQEEKAQEHARWVIGDALNGRDSSRDFVVTVGKEAMTPSWLKAIGAKPANLGLDLRGGVHFLLQVDMNEALTARMEALAGNIRTDLRNQNIRYLSVTRTGQTVEVTLPDSQTLAAARANIKVADEMQVTQDSANGTNRLQITLLPQAARKIQELALLQNITTLHKRINSLGVAEPLIQQQGLDRIVVQLPGLDDPSQAKEILGRTATLQIRMVDDSPQALAAQMGQGPVPLGSERFTDRYHAPIILRNEVILTGENLKDAQPGRAHETNQPAVFLNLDSAGARIFYDVTRQNQGRRMAIVLFEEGKGEVVTAPSINGPISGGRVEISGHMSVKESQNIALLLRSGSLAAPMQIIEERTIGPSLGEVNIDRGINSVVYGFAIVAIFMCAYYMLFGVFSTVSMAINLLLLVSVLSLMQATLTLPGIAAMALALGMAIDANVLINERIREELRAGASPQMAISAGYEHAWRTILDSNVTSLIAGIALLTCDAGPVRGFAVVHCLGIMTSLFSSVFVSRGLVNLWYGRQRKIKSLKIGQIWKPKAS